MSKEIELGEMINRPPISSKLKPGSWYQIDPKNANFILTSLSDTLSYIENTLKQTLPDSLNITLYKCGTQIVSQSINVYIEFRINNMPDNQTRDVKAIINDRSVSVKDKFEHNLQVKKIYYTSKKVLEESEGYNVIF